MYFKLKIVKIDTNYCEYLRKFDSRVPYTIGNKELRPFIGVLFMVDKCEYFAPLSSPKPKHKKMYDSIDLLKIQNGDYGVINFNNMIPVKEDCYKEFDLKQEPRTKEERYRFELLNNQMRWLTANRKEIFKKSKLLYALYKNKDLSIKVINRCCNFQLLEEKCNEYNK